MRWLSAFPGSDWSSSDGSHACDWAVQLPITCNWKSHQWSIASRPLHNDCMLDVHAAATQDLTALSPAELSELVTQMLAHITEQSKHIDAQSKRIDSQAQAIKWRDAKIESITFQLARLKAWKFGAKSERMNAAQRDIFEEALAADQADLEAQLAALQQHSRPASGAAPDEQQRRQPKREALPPHLPRVEQRIEPEDTRCPTPECRQPMV
ncbi:MAG TPA: transposase, partial [Polyangiales bacterium]